MNLAIKGAIVRFFCLATFPLTFSFIAEPAAATATRSRGSIPSASRRIAPTGSGPLASPIVGTDGTLYGTTALDSRAYSFAPQTSTYTVLHTFCTDAKCSDGIEPLSPLTPDAAGHLFGTTAFGGTKHSGGTVFVLTP